MTKWLVVLKSKWWEIISFDVENDGKWLKIISDNVDGTKGKYVDIKKWDVVDNIWNEASDVVSNGADWWLNVSTEKLIQNLEDMENKVNQLKSVLKDVNIQYKEYWIMLMLMCGESDNLISQISNKNPEQISQTFDIFRTKCLNQLRNKWLDDVLLITNDFYGYGNIDYRYNLANFITINDGGNFVKNYNNCKTFDEKRNLFITRLDEYDKFRWKVQNFIENWWGNNSWMKNGTESESNFVDEWNKRTWKNWNKFEWEIKDGKIIKWIFFISDWWSNGVCHVERDEKWLKIISEWPNANKYIDENTWEIKDINEAPVPVSSESRIDFANAAQYWTWVEAWKDWATSQIEGSSVSRIESQKQQETAW